jgi:predicted RNase H-like nuclease (RuvC/YqgF family)
MNALDVVSTGALMLLGAILLVLLMQTLKLREIWQMMLASQKIARWASIWEMENKELRSALRAEKAHVEQLKRKLVILQALVPAA